MWMRVTLTAPSDPPHGTFGPNLADGRGPIGGFKFGETEDYLLRAKLIVVSVFNWHSTHNTTYHYVKLCIFNVLYRQKIQVRTV